MVRLDLAHDLYRIIETPKWYVAMALNAPPLSPGRVFLLTMYCIML